MEFCLDECCQVWIRLREIVLWVKEREKGGGGEKKGKGNGAGVTTFKCGCSPEFLSSLNIEDNIRLDCILYGCIGTVLPSPSTCQVFINVL